VRLIQKWRNAGVLEDGERTCSEVGTVQGGSISPLLAHLYLHYAFDRWVPRWRQTQAQGEVVVVRFADDCVVGFQYRPEAERFLAALRERVAKFSLALHPDKTRLIEFGPVADRNRRGRGQGQPATFNFLGFTHICGQTRRGRCTVLRQTVRRRLLAQLQEVKTELRRRMHLPIPEQGAYVRSVVGGHLRYFGVPRNGPAIRLFHQGVGRLSHRVLLRRSQTHCLPWCRMRRYITRWLPPARICHPYPLVRLGVVTQGRRRMQSCCMSGSVEGVMGNHASYSDYGSAPLAPSARRDPTGVAPRPPPQTRLSINRHLRRSPRGAEQFAKPRPCSRCARSAWRGGVLHDLVAVTPNEV
jgi:hypothetical protein